MTRQSLSAFRQTITVKWPQQRDADAKALLIRTAQEGHARIMREQASRAGVAPDFDAYANMPGNPNLQSVKLPGPIVYRYRYFREIVEFGLAALLQASPVQSGRYRNSHVVLVNGQQVDIVPTRLRETDVITLVNPVPYARRLEIGKTKAGRDFVLQVPNRIYERVAKQRMIPRYRNVANITFGYLELTGAHTIRGGLSPSYGTGNTPGIRGGGVRRKRRQSVGSAVRAPAIFIKALV